MSKTYSKYEHTHVTIRHPDKSDGWDGPHEIVLHTGTHVWIDGCYAMQGHAQVLQVGIGGPSSTAFDEDGNCVLAVPSEWCEYWTLDEAESIEQMIYADAQLLSYAR